MFVRSTFISPKSAYSASHHPSFISIPIDRQRRHQCVDGWPTTVIITRQTTPHALYQFNLSPLSPMKLFFLLLGDRTSERGSTKIKIKKKQNDVSDDPRLFCSLLTHVVINSVLFFLSTTTTNYVFSISIR